MERAINNGIIDPSEETIDVAGVQAFLSAYSYYHTSVRLSVRHHLLVLNASRRATVAYTALFLIYPRCQIGIAHFTVLMLLLVVNNCLYKNIYFSCFITTKATQNIFRGTEKIGVKGGSAKQSTFMKKIT